MSQIYKTLTSGGPIPPSIPTSFVTDNGTVDPSGNTVNINGSSTTANNTNGIQVIANPTGTNNELVQLTNTVIGSVTTTNAALTTIITFPLSASATVYGFYGDIVARDITDAAGAFYSIISCSRTDGTTAIEVGVEYDTQLEDGVMAPADIFSNVSGNNLLIQVQGVAGKTIDWFAKFQYIQVS